MSLDDETPTEYFGPDARSWVHPVTGKMHRLSPADYERAEERKAQYFAGQENKDHRAGCPIERTGRCSCEYLAQWDDDAEAAHNSTVQLSADGSVALVERKLPVPEIRYGEPPAEGIDADDLPPGGVLYIPESMRQNMERADNREDESLILPVESPSGNDDGPFKRAHDTITFLNDNNLPITQSFGDPMRWLNDYRPGMHTHGIVATDIDGKPLAGEGYEGLFTLGNAGEIRPLGTHPLTMAGKDVAAAVRDANKALDERDRQIQRAEAWRATAFLMLGTLVCILLGVVGRESGWY